LGTSFATWAGADRPDVHRLIADGVEQRLLLVEDGAIAADPEGELARARALRAAAHRRVQQVQTASGELLVQPKTPRSGRRR